jgi:ABC-type dipeptide/oligopeptide/nickel transport system permease component
MEANRGDMEKSEVNMKIESFVLKRIVFLVLSFVALSFVIFVLIYCAHMSIFGAMIDPGPGPEFYHHMWSLYGRESSWYIQYYCWMKQVLTGNLGISFTFEDEITQTALKLIPRTLSYQVIGLTLSVVIGVPAGVVCAVRNVSIIGRVISKGSLICVSFPIFFLILLVEFFFTEKTGWLPSEGLRSLEIAGGSISYYVNYLKCVTVPTLGLTIICAGYITVSVRSLLDRTLEDTIARARAKGIKGKSFLYRKALEKSVPSIVRFFGVTIGIALGASPLIEWASQWPGMGTFFVHATQLTETLVMMGLTLVFGSLILITKFCAELVYGLIYPRCRDTL